MFIPFTPTGLSYVICKEKLRSSLIGSGLATHRNVGVVSREVMGPVIEPIVAHVVGDVDVVMTSLDLITRRLRGY